MDTNSELESLCHAIETHQKADNALLARLLCAEDINVRLEANSRLASIYYYKLQNIDKALVYAHRAFVLSGVNEYFSTFCVEILHKAGDANGKRAIYKEMGCRFSEIGDIMSALRYFDLHRDVYANSGMGDRYEYDFDVLKRIRDLASTYRQKCERTTSLAHGNKIRLAYLVFGIQHSNSVIVELMAQYAKYHDVARFDVVFFIVESSDNNSDIERRNIDLLKSAGAEVVQAGLGKPLDCLFEAARNINNFGPDILISTAILANYAHYFVYSLVEAVKKVSYCFGPPEQFIPPNIDGIICPAAHPAIESSNRTTLIHLEFDLSRACFTKSVSRESVGLPDDAVIIVAAGRPSKFLNKEYWQAIFSVLNSCNDAYFVAIGLSVIPPFFSDILPENLVGRIKIFGWLDDYLTILKLADIVVDTFPSGGGVVLLEAMAADIPAITFDEDFSCRFNQMNWNPGAEMVPVQQLILPRWDFVALEHKLIELIGNRSLRVKLGELCGQETRLHRGSPERYVQSCEISLESYLKHDATPQRGVLKVLQVNGYESPGRRFNGLSITPHLQKYNIQSRHLIWEKDTQNPEVLTFEGKWLRKVNRLLNRVERATSMQSVLYQNAAQMMKMPAFQAADVLHLHIIHSGYLNMSDLPMITQAKPTVWTLHDPWPMTGHCIYPFDCTRWKVGCGNCPDLNIPFPMLMDTTKFLFNYKRRAYKKSKFDVIVASRWMRDMVEASPLFEDVDIHQIPFGLDLNFFSPVAAPNARKRFGIPDDALVICFRAVGNEFKGLPYIIQALERIRSKQPVCLLTLNTKGLLERFAGRFQLVELGWTNDEELTRDAFIASDIFLMPSIVEAFGVMAIEAFACGKPVIVFDGTSLPEVTFAPDIGLSVPMRDGEALFQALQRLIDNPNEREERGRKGRQMAEMHYSDDMYAKRLADTYRIVAAK